MRRIWPGRLLLACLIAFAPVAATAVAHANTNLQEGDNRSDTDQSGSGGSGDAVAGQVAGVDSGGSASVDATNATDKSSASTGDARGTNAATEDAGLISLSFCGATADCPNADLATSNPTASAQEGDNTVRTDQSADTTSGDAVAGGVVGVVTSFGGSADLVLANSTLSSDAESGDAHFDNDVRVAAGLLNSSGACCPIPTDVLGTPAQTSLSV